MDKQRQYDRNARPLNLDEVNVRETTSRGVENEELVGLYSANYTSWRFIDWFIWLVPLVWCSHRTHVLCFWRCLWLFCLCVKYLENRTAERICDKFTGKTCLVPRSDETSLNVRDKGQRSRSSGTKTGFSALLARPACVFSSSSVGFCICFFIVCLYCSLFLQPTVLFTILCQK